METDQPVLLYILGNSGCSVGGCGSHGGCGLESSYMPPKKQHKKRALAPARG